MGFQSFLVVLFAIQAVVRGSSVNRTICSSQARLPALRRVADLILRLFIRYIVMPLADQQFEHLERIVDRTATRP